MNADEFFRGNLTPANFALQRARERLRKLQAGQVGLKTKLKVLDDYVRLLPGELTAIGARSGTGKTALGMQLVYSVLTQMIDANLTGCIAVFSAEMDGESLMLREACALEKVQLWQVLNGEASSEEIERVDWRLSVMEGTRLLIDESPAPTLEHMIDQLSAVNEERGPIRLVLFDYTELSGEFDRDEGRRIAKISRGLKAIAKKFATPVLTLSQLNRDIESRADKTPTMRDLMHGGEREPDRILILVRSWFYDKTQPRELIAGHIVKNRNGRLGEVSFFFDEQTMRFKSATVERKELE